MYTKHSNGFYVRAKPNLCTPDITIKYISRYIGRPVIATSRIDNYDGENVTFHYTRHEDNKTVTETIPALNFIQKLIVHIPEKQRHGEAPFALLLCRFLFLAHYTPFLTIWEISYIAKK